MRAARLFLLLAIYGSALLLGCTTPAPERPKKGTYLERSVEQARDGISVAASVLLIMNQEPDRWPEWLVALVLAWLASGVIILLSTALARRLGRRVLIAI